MIIATTRSASRPSVLEKSRAGRFDHPALSWEPLPSSSDPRIFSQCHWAGKARCAGRWMSAFGGKADISHGWAFTSANDPKRTSVAHSDGLSSYLFRFSKVLPAKTITTKMMPASASVRIVLRAMPRPKCPTTPKMTPGHDLFRAQNQRTINRVVSRNTAAVSAANRYGFLLRGGKFGAGENTCAPNRNRQRTIRPRPSLSAIR